MKNLFAVFLIASSTAVAAPEQAQKPVAQKPAPTTAAKPSTATVAVTPSAKPAAAKPAAAAAAQKPASPAAPAAKPAASSAAVKPAAPAAKPSTATPAAKPAEAQKPAQASAPAAAPAPQASSAPRTDTAASDKAAAEETREQLNVLDRYSNVDPEKVIPRKLLADALINYDNRLPTLKNQKYITIIDYSQPSTQKRFYIIEMKTGKVWRTYVAHGKGSEPIRNGRAVNFGNTNSSHRTSIGLFRTANTYNGKHGLSLYLDGLSATNSNARARAIVVHGANYVQDKPVVQGRSYGCPAIPMKYRNKVIDMIKGGSLILAAKTQK